MSVTRNFGPLTSIPLTNRALMREVGLLVRERIQRRTRQGQGTDRPLTAYSPGYAARKAQELGAGRVNLTVSGAMLNDITILRVTDTEVELGFIR